MGIQRGTQEAEGSTDGSNVIRKGRTLGMRMFCSQRAGPNAVESRMGDKLKVETPELPLLFHTVMFQQP